MAINSTHSFSEVTISSDEFYSSLTVLTQKISNLIEFYRSFLIAIQKENDYLKENGPYEIEPIIKDKIHFAVEIEKSSLDIKKNSEDLREIIYKLSNCEKKPSLNLSLLFEEVVKFIGRYPNQFKDAYIYLNKLKTQMDILIEVKDSSRKLVELNSYVIDQFLLQNGNLMDLWQKVLIQSEQTYSNIGIKKKTKVNTSLRTKV